MKTKGFTLIELAVVLAIIAVLAAILTPLVTGYLDQARIARAQADVRTIADALKLHQRDTTKFPIYLSNGVIIGTGKTVIGGPGNEPTESVTWGSLAATTLSTTTLEAYINGNFTSVSTSNAFPKSGFRGPYIANIEADPWGNKYLVNANHLHGNDYHSFVISAGPDGDLDTTKDQVITSTVVVGSDDIMAVIK
jgi:prepilin-type N-terminal cleavage/methylation domain-containing protein